MTRQPFPRAVIVTFLLFVLHGCGPTFYGQAQPTVETWEVTTPSTPSGGALALTDERAPRQGDRLSPRRPLTLAPPTQSVTADRRHTPSTE